MQVSALEIKTNFPFVTENCILLSYLVQKCKEKQTHYPCFIHDLALNLRGKEFLIQYIKIALIFKQIELEICALAHLKEN